MKKSSSARQYEIRVLMQYTPQSGLHSVYQELVNYPPKNCTFLPFPVKGVSRLLSAGTYYCNLPNIGIAPKNADLIHSHQQLLLGKTPWVVDFEHVGAFVHFHHQALNSRLNKRIIERCLSSKYCKKIMPWSFAAKRSLENAINTSKFENKIEVVYPAIHNIEFKKIKKHEFSILFIGIRFVVKGGKEVLEAFEILNKKYDVELTLISNIPKYIKEQYKHYDNIKIIDPIPRNHIFENYYPKADVFVFPTRIDTFGMVLLEAMNFELPVISTNIFAMPEIIENGKNGFLISTKITQYTNRFIVRRDTGIVESILEKKSEKAVVEQIVEKISMIIEDPKLGRKMGKNGKKEIQKGRFSVDIRNKKLKSIYETCLSR